MMYVYQFSGMQWGAHLLGSMLWVWWLLPEYESYCARGIADSPPPIQKQNTTFCSGVQTAAVFIYGRQIPRCIQAILMLTHCGGLALWVCVLLPHFCSCGNHLSFIHPHFCICQKIILTSHHSSGLSLQAWFSFFFFFMLLHSQQPWPEAFCFGFSVHLLFLWTRYLRKTLREFPPIYHKYLLGPKGELFRFWWSLVTVKQTLHRNDWAPEKIQNVFVIINNLLFLTVG